MLKELYRLWQSKKKPFPVKIEHRIVEAFNCGGVQYYEFDDAFNVPCARMFAAMNYYAELQMRCTREFLQAHCAAVNNSLKNPKTIDITKIVLLTQQLEERLNLIFDHEILYKLASVIYFDKSENPYSFDYKYALQKVQAWKKEKVEDFFLSQPLRKFIPLKDMSESDLLNYMKIAELMQEQQLASIFSMLSEKDKKKDFFNKLQSLKPTA